ncbi:MAG: sugar phosphate isomerase/epimerase family protein [Candidatus Latescibacterota bacterium]|jgi:sugar phosphate isomerase/epimerase
MDISCCAWALSGPEETALDQLASWGFDSIDVQARTFANATARTQMSALGLSVRCVALSFNIPEEAALDSPEPTARRAALAHIETGLDQAASYGVDTAYVVPGLDPELLGYFSESFIAAADLAAARNIKLCVEHFPDKALPTASGTLAYLDKLAHDNLYLLMDSGHLQISNESPVETIVQAGAKLGYAHLDDNDGEDDLHWSLCDGVLSRDALAATLEALEKSVYDGPVSLELHPELPDPAAALQQSLSLVKEILTEE